MKACICVLVQIHFTADLIAHLWNDLSNRAELPEKYCKELETLAAAAARDASSAKFFHASCVCVCVLVWKKERVQKTESTPPRQHAAQQGTACKRSVSVV